jgi:hypothetical protein
MEDDGIMEIVWDYSLFMGIIWDYMGIIWDYMGIIGVLSQLMGVSGAYNHALIICYFNCTPNNHCSVSSRIEGN